MMKKILLIVVVMLIFSCYRNAEKVVYIQGKAQGTTYHIKYIGEQIPFLKRSVDSILEVIDQSMSTYRDDSLISQFNTEGRVKADTHFVNVFNASKKVWGQSNGFFDPTVGALVEAWGFGRVSHQNVPSSKQIDEMLKCVGMDKLYLDTEGCLLSVVKGVDINFNAIAQGYSVDVVSDYLKKKNIHNFIVEIGGELYVSGMNVIDNKPWRLGIDNPLQSLDKRDLIAVIEIQEGAIATSGNYRKVWTDPQTGQRYVHTLNPKTGKPELSNILSATVISQNAVFADAYATTLMVMGLERAKKFLREHPQIDAYINYFENGEMKSFSTEGFDKYIVELL